MKSQNTHSTERRLLSSIPPIAKPMALADPCWAWPGKLEGPCPVGLAGSARLLLLALLTLLESMGWY